MTLGSFGDREGFGREGGAQGTPTLPQFCQLLLEIGGPSVSFHYRSPHLSYCWEHRVGSSF